MNISAGVAAEFRVIVKDSVGNVKQDTGYQKNMVLNKGLAFLGEAGGDNPSTNFFYACCIGSGNTAVSAEQTTLASQVAEVAGSTIAINKDYVPNPDNIYKTSREAVYSFSGLGNKNITEVGLKAYSLTGVQPLCTRALIKNALGEPITISIITGDILVIYYKVYMVISTADKVQTVLMDDGLGNTVPYNVTIRPAKVGDIVWGLLPSSGTINNYVGSALNSVANYFNTNALYYNDLESITGNSSYDGSYQVYAKSGSMEFTKIPEQPYKAIFTFQLTPSEGNDVRGIRRAYVESSMGAWQIRYGRVSDDAPIFKTNTEQLTIPIEISWGRYEGVL